MADGQPAEPGEIDRYRLANVAVLLVTVGDVVGTLALEHPGIDGADVASEIASVGRDLRDVALQPDGPSGRSRSIALGEIGRRLILLQKLVAATRAGLRRAQEEATDAEHEALGKIDRALRGTQSALADTAHYVNNCAHEELFR